MIDFLKTYSYAMWLGGSLVYSGIPMDNINYWFVMIPTIFLVGFKCQDCDNLNHMAKEEEK